MWLFWRPRNRLSLDELRYLTEQLEKIQIVNDANKDFVIEALRSIAELVTYGDQHDPSYFEYFMEKQIMGEFARILRVSQAPKIALQLLQTMSIMIQNLRSQNSIYYIFSNEYINYLITYSFDFQNEEILSFYISFLRAISGKLNKGTISLLVKTENDEVVSFPLYVEAIKFAFHEETMIRIAVRTLTLNVYHVGDQSVNKFVTLGPLSNYFSDIVKSFQKQCVDLDKLVQRLIRSSSDDNTSSLDFGPVLDAVQEIEESLFYFSDVMSSDVPDLGGLIASNILHLLVFPLLLPALEDNYNSSQIGTTTALYLLCCILHVFKSKDLASTVAATLFCRSSSSNEKSEMKSAGCASEYFISESFQNQQSASTDSQTVKEVPRIHMPNSFSSPSSPDKFSISNCSFGKTLRELLLFYIVSGNDLQALGSICFFSTLLRTKELEESMLDKLGILPQRKQQKKLLLQSLVGEDFAEEQLFATDNGIENTTTNSEFNNYLANFENQYGLQPNREMDPKLHHQQMLDALVSLFCRSDVAADICWVGGWLFRQLLPHGEEFSALQLRKLKDSFLRSATKVLEEVRGCWCDLLFSVIKHAWKSCKEAIEASSPPKDPKSVLLPLDSWSCREHMQGEYSIVSGERMLEMVKIFVLQRQLLMFCVGQTPGEEPLSHLTPDYDCSIPKPGIEVDLDGAIPCRIAFERGKERHFSFSVLLKGISGVIVLIEELPLIQGRGIVRVLAPLAGANPRIDEKHPKWLHLRIRPSTLPFLDSLKSDYWGSKSKSKYLVDGRWVLAFQDQESCKSAESMILEEMKLQQTALEIQLKPLLDFTIPGDERESQCMEGDTSEHG